MARRRLRKLKDGVGYCKRCQLMGTLHGGVCNECLHNNPAPKWEPTSLVAKSEDGRTKIVYRHSHRVYEVYTEGQYVGKDDNRIAAYFMAGIPLPREGW